MRKRIAGFAVLAVVLSLCTGAPSASGQDPPTTCAPGGHLGGDWRSAGHDLSNTRSQPNENVISPQNVADLEVAWTFNTQENVDLGDSGGGFYSTPVVADGCAYLTTSAGWVFAVNADEGDVVWKTKLDGQSSTLIGGVITGSATVADGVVYVGVSRPSDEASGVAALDQATGTPLWFSVVETGWNAIIVAAPVVVNGMVFQGFVGSEGDPDSRGGYAIVDASRECGDAPFVTCFAPSGGDGGRHLAHRYTVSDEEYATGYRGASVWCTAAADPVSGHIYACTGNPQSEGLEARLANSLLKIDVDTESDSFGDVVAAYKGHPDQYVEGLHRQPVCDEAGDVAVLWSVQCFMLDLDFGASPNLFPDHLGNLMVGDLQKAGVYHGVNADTMSGAWETVVGGPCLACNGTSGAYADGTIFTVGSPPGLLIAISAGEQEARYRWVYPLADGVHYQPISTANGVVYVVDGLGTLNAVDAATGVPLMRRLLANDVGATDTITFDSQGVSIARNTVYAATGPYVVAYQLPEG